MDSTGTSSHQLSLVLHESLVFFYLQDPAVGVSAGGTPAIKPSAPL